jgi:hypothetical protein
MGAQRNQEPLGEQDQEQVEFLGMEAGSKAVQDQENFVAHIIEMQRLVSAFNQRNA